MSDANPSSVPAAAATAATLPPTNAPGAVAPSSADTPVQRYQLLDEIAHGGMGVIWRATDMTLSREVAVKVLQDKYAPDSGIARRFADEARITAQLQHPAIPPVHDIGTLSDGRPFLAMKLIKGQTLEKLLAERPDPSAEHGRFVAVFEQVCQAVAYAHAHGVIHRDLKPANVMVGAFGEVQLMDWGLAKVLAVHPVEAADPAATTAGTAVVSLRDADGKFTQAGSVLGTPAFMPPEQAIGAVAKVDQRSDVFGLGALLAVILTGEPPFAGSSAETTRVKAALGDVSECFARLDSCGAEPELAALCKRCLSPRASERPVDGAEVAAAVASLRQAAEERARAAELERVRAELRTLEFRKRRWVERALALLLISGLAYLAIVVYKTYTEVVAFFTEPIRLARKEIRYADSVPLFERVFADDPNLAEDLKAGRRYAAACCAASAGCGEGKDADELKDKDKAKLREKALAWLRADLTLRRRQASSGKAAQRQEAVAQLSRWQRDSELAGVRPGPHRVAMPDEERATWDKLWEDVNTTLALAQKTPIATSGK